MSALPELSTRRLVLRAFRPGDEDDIVRHANDRAVWLGLRDIFPHPYTHADARDWVERCSRATVSTEFAITLSSAVIGGIGLVLGDDVYAHSAEIGYWLGAAHWGNGYATEAVMAVTDYAFEELGLVRVHAGVFASNPRSASVLRKAGYTLEGTERSGVIKDGQLLDRHWFARLRSG